MSDVEPRSRGGCAAFTVLALGAGLLGLWSMRPPPTSPAPLTRIPATPPASVAPEPPRTAERAERAPDRADAQTEQAWHDEVARLVGEANGACGYRHEVTCLGGACAVAFTPSDAERVIALLRRPMRLVEPALPRPWRPCDVASSRIVSKLPLYIHSPRAAGQSCHGFTLRGHPHAGGQVVALCRQLLGQPPLPEHLGDLE